MKSIAIVGGGISGAALLHYLNKRYFDRKDVKIELFEKTSRLGGTIHSIKEHGCVFETGPNGFLDSKERTLNFVKELGLENKLIYANESAKIRFISINNQLYEAPFSPQRFFKFPLLSFQEKLRVFREIFVPRGNRTIETVYDFGLRRFGKRFTELFIDSAVNGIHGGDIRKLVLKYAFPKIYETEQQRSSLFLAQFAKGQKPGKLTSFNSGMQEVIDRVYYQYKDQIFLNGDVKEVIKDGHGFILKTSFKNLKFDEIFLCVPADIAAECLKTENGLLASLLNKIYYAPMAVVGLVYEKSSINDMKGFGYLKPSSENSPVLGCLFEHHIYPSRVEGNSLFYRVMIGGSCHPNTASLSENDLVNLAKKELARTLKIATEPKAIFFQRWKKAIPQYDMQYAEIVNQIKPILNQYHNMHIVANYWNGVAFNDCIENAYQASCK